MSDEIERVPEAPAALTPAGMHPLFQAAIEKGPDGVAALEKLVELHERMENRRSAQEFAAAMAAFQEECPPIRKTSTAKVTTKSGGQYTYQYAELDEIARTVRPILHKHGLSYSWDSQLSPDGSMIRAVCSLAHANGHKVTATFEAPTEAVTHAMSPQQKHAAALTYARRQSLIQVLGLTTTDADTDAQADEATVSPEQVLVLEDLIDKRPAGSRARLLAWLGVETMEAVPASRFDFIRKDLEEKIKAQG